METPEFFNQSDIDNLRKFAGQRYDGSNPRQKKGYDELKATYRKVEHWGQETLARVFPDGAMHIVKKPTNQASKFENYLWAKLYPTKELKEWKKLAFTVSLSKEYEDFCVKIDTVGGLSESDPIRNKYLEYRGDFFTSPIIKSFKVGEVLGKDWGWLINESSAAIKTLEGDYWKLLTSLKHDSTLQSKGRSEQQKSEPIRRYWVVAPGDNASKWAEFYDKGIIGIGWEDTGDLAAYESREEIREYLLSAYPDGSKSQKHNSLALWEFFDVMKPGDILIPKRGTSEYLGYGVVTGQYVFDDSAENYSHTREVDWKKKGRWPEDVHRIVTKTLTDITKYPEYVDRLKRLIGIEQAAIIPSEVNYWWLNANPNVWRITDFEVGQEQTYTTYNDKGNKRTHYEYFHQVKKGDLFLGYASSPVKKVVSIFEATKPVYINDDTGQEEIAFIIQKFLPDPVSIETIVGLAEFDDSEIKNNRQGSLYKLTKEQYHAVLNDDVVKEQEIEEYGKEDALEQLFLEDAEFENILKTIRYKKNIILQGPPGTGKTFMAKLIAYSFMEERDKSKIEMIQFHQSYSYEDFMQGYRPQEDGKFRLEFGVFYRFCKRAQSDPIKKYFFIIDEINRGNLSKIFGELMLLLEGDKHGPQFEVSLTYSQGLESKFYIPENVYLIGTMNTADRSLSIVDYALRRRFAFIDVNPTFNSKFRQYLQGCGVSDNLIDRICVRIEKLNGIIEKSLGRGFRIGHSYFCNVSEGTADDEWYNRIVAMEIDPLLREYWFDKIETAEREIENLYN